MIETLKQLFTRDLMILKKEINLYRAESDLWVLAEGIENSGGNLCLHLIGNLNHFIGAIIGKTDYIRKRDLEFSLKNIPRSELISEIDNTRDTITNTLEGLSVSNLGEEYPVLVFKEKTTVGFFLIHLLTHLTYHRGQINYHRRLLDN